MPKLILHLVVLTIFLHLPFLASPAITVPDLVAVVLLVAKIQNSAVGLWLLATLFGIFMEITGGTPYGIKLAQYLLMLMLLNSIAKRINKPTNTIMLFWGILSYLCASVVLLWAIAQFDGGNYAFNRNTIYSAVLTILVLPIWHVSVRYSLRVKNAR